MYDLAKQKEQSTPEPLSKRVGAAIGAHRWYFYGGLFSCVAMLTFILLAERFHPYAAIYHTLAGVFVLISFHSFEKLYSEEQARLRAEATVNSIAHKMNSGITSLNELNSAQIREVYADRVNAERLMADAIRRSGNQELLLMGVSLNDFLATGVRDSLKELSGAFKDFVARHDTSVAVLLIDPTSDAAEQRERAEETNPDLKRLEREARTSVEMLTHLFKSRASGDSDANLAYRLYRSVPTVFVLMTNYECFVQPYYFWPERGVSRELPMFHITLGERYDGLTRNLERGDRNKFKADNVLFNGVLAHFSWIWRQYSITKHDYDSQLADTGKQVRPENLAAIYSAIPSEFGKERINRIINLVKNAKKRVWIVGFTVKFFFANQNATDALLEAANNLHIKWEEKDNLAKTTTAKSDAPNGIKLGTSSSTGTVHSESVPDWPDEEEQVRILLIDPHCEEALLRMFRERDLDRTDPAPVQGIKNHDDFVQKFDAFKADKETLESMTLSRDVADSLRRAQDSERKFKVRNDLSHDLKLLHIKQFEHFPACFMCLVDDTVFVEQYHYGEGLKGELGKDMPILEFRAGTSDNGQKLPYELLESHFRFIWQISREVKTETSHCKELS